MINNKYRRNLYVLLISINCIILIGLLISSCSYNVNKRTSLKELDMIVDIDLIPFESQLSGTELSSMLMDIDELNFTSVQLDEFDYQNYSSYLIKFSEKKESHGTNGDVIFFNNSLDRNPTLYGVIENDVVDFNLHLVKNGHFLYFDESGETADSFIIYIENNRESIHFYRTPHNSFIHFYTKETLFYGFSLGAIFIIFISNLLIAHYLNQKHFFLHALYLLNVFLFLSSRVGIMQIFGFELSYDNLGTISILGFICLVFFFYYRFNLSKRNKIIKFYVLGCILTLYILLLFSLLGVTNNLMLYLLRIVGAVILISLSGIILKFGFAEKENRLSIRLGFTVIILLLLVAIFNRLYFQYQNTYSEKILALSVIIGGILFSSSIGISLKYSDLRNQHLEKITYFDQLTNLHNRIYFNHIYPETVNQISLNRGKLSVIIFDIDYFKKVNDRFGHSCGDEVLSDLGLLVNECVRSSDIAFRWGGEEFLVLLPGADIKGAQILAEKIRYEIENHCFEKVGKVTASFGVHQIKHLEEYKSWYTLVDEALYEAKESGRNKVVSN